MGVKSNKNKAYVVWKSMMQRCYKKYVHVHHPTYANCYVCENWFDFEKFENWFDENYIEGFFLDKDILLEGNRIYSPNTCCFVPREINSIFSKKSKSTHEGVKIRKNNRFQARIFFNGREKILGTFGSLKEATDVYKKEKKKCIRKLAEKHKRNINKNVYLALIKYSL